MPEKNKYFDEIKGVFGFGCMRLPMKDGEVDYAEFCAMADEFIGAGFNYFDTAHGYLDGKSEIAIRECVAKRYPRESFLLVNKLTTDYFEKQEDIEPFFQSQLEACGVEYFDVYLMHAQNAEFYKKYKACRAYETAYAFKAEGKIRHFGISFHDKAEVLDMILSEHPEIEVVQIQLNYLDCDDVIIEGRKCYEVCRKYNKPIIVMEPVKGGILVDLPKKAAAILDELDGSASKASYAIRYTASFEGVAMVLSGMSNMEQMKDNLSFMKDFKPFCEREFDAVRRVAAVLNEKQLIGCTACKYCVAGCPKKISIPDLFACMNAKTSYTHDFNSEWYYKVYTQNAGKASDCIKCGKCEKTCPQHLKIRDLLQKVAETFEKAAE